MLLSKLRVVATPAEYRLPPGVHLPEKDGPVLAAAIAAGATHLLTGDTKHFGPLFGKTIQGVTILLSAIYLRGRDLDNI